jgi:predicted MFS family arabinose efflux permease
VTGPLAEREFRLLFLGRTTSILGSAFAPVAIAFALLDIGSPSDLGLVLAASTIPTVVFMLVGGVLSDRLPRHSVMVWSNVLSGAAQAVFAVLILSGRAQLWELIVVQAAKGTVSAFFVPASQGIIPQTVPRERLRQANSILSLSSNACRIAGAALAGLTVAGVGPGWALVIDAASYLVAAAFLAPMRSSAAERMDAPSFLGELREGWREFSGRAWLWVVVAAFAFLNAAEAGAFNVLGPTVAKRELGGAAAWGFILTGEGVGLIVGGLFGLRIRPRRALLLGCAAVGLIVPPLVLLALGAPLAVLIASTVLMGTGLELFSIYWATSLQEHIPLAMLSRVASYDMLGSLVLMPIGFAVIGPIAARVGIDATLYGAAAFVGLATLVMVLTPDIRRLEHAHARAPA